MIVVKITMNAIPGKQLEVIQTLLSMIEPTKKEKGCLRYGAFCDIENNNRFNLYQKWKTRKDLDHHISSHRFGVLLGTKALLCEPLNIRIYTVSLSEGMEAVHAARNKKKNDFSKGRSHLPAVPFCILFRLISILPPSSVQKRI